jgi:hypothetical protein
MGAIRIESSCGRVHTEVEEYREHPSVGVLAVDDVELQQEPADVRLDSPFAGLARSTSADVTRPGQADCPGRLSGRASTMR